MKTFLIISVLVIFFLFWNNHQIPLGPHKGTVKQAENFKIEKLHSHDVFYAFLLDNKSKPISNAGITAEARFYFSDQSTADIPLKPFGEDGFTAGVYTLGYYSCRITFHVHGKSISAIFDNENAIVNKSQLTMSSLFINHW